MRLITSLILLLSLAVSTNAQTNAPGQAVEKIEDIVIYKDPLFHCAFPSIVQRSNGELLLAFRRAPDWRPFGTKSYTHTDPNSYLVTVRSQDDGKTWTSEPQLLFAHPLGGSQDPCLLQLRDGTLLCSSYGWSPGPRADVPDSKVAAFRKGAFAFMGGYVLRSTDGGKFWEKPIIPPASKNEVRTDMFGKPLPAYNRGALCEGTDGRIFWAVVSHDDPKSHASTHLMISDDKGLTWHYGCPIAANEKMDFTETSLYQTPKGDLLAFMRTTDFDDHTCVARSTDGGKSFEKWEDAGFQGHPHYALRLPDDRVLLVYGYRHPPMGIRARVLDPECTNISRAKEIILRDDGGSQDLGYPWATMIGKDRALVVYYFNQTNGTRYIAGTFLGVNSMH